MPSPSKDAFLAVYPKCLVIFLGIIEFLCFLLLIATELGNVAANFWITNVFAGGWCGLIIFIHFISIFVAGCCSPGPPAAFRAVVITVIALLASGTLIGFDAYFIAQPSTCILTSSCSSNAVSTTIFSYSFQQNFLTTFNTLGPFQTYTVSQAKLLFQAIQLGIGGLCFVLCLIHLIIYYVTKSKALKRVGPSQQQQLGYYSPQPHYQQKKQTGSNAPRPYYQQKQKRRY